LTAWLLAGERAALGVLREELAERQAAWVNDPGNKATLRHLGIYTTTTERAWIEEATKAMGGVTPAAVHFAIHDVDDGEPVGSCGLHAIDWASRTSEFGILIGERRGTGLGTDATRLTLRWAWEVLRLESVWLHALASNAAGLHAYERAGFERVGVRRRGVHGQDVVLMDAVRPDLLAER
jgi:RimJ/RimL family protein N-acetyltransferase